MTPEQAKKLQETLNTVIATGDDDFIALVTPHLMEQHGSGAPATTQPSEPAPVLDPPTDEDDPLMDHATHADASRRLAATKSAAEYRQVKQQLDAEQLERDWQAERPEAGDSAVAFHDSRRKRSRSRRIAAAQPLDEKPKAAKADDEEPAGAFAGMMARRKARSRSTKMGPS